MGKITKIMLTLNILAGGAAIFFGMGLKDNLNIAVADKTNAEAVAQQAAKSKGELETSNTKLNSDLQLANGRVASVSNQLSTAQQTLSTLQGGQGQMTKELQDQQAKMAQLQSQLSEASGIAQKATRLERDILDYQALGTPPELRKMKKQLENIEAAKAAKNQKNKPKKNPSSPSGEIGSIASYDPKFKFYVINRGSDHGIKSGDEYNVIRAGNLVGKIKIKQTQPTVSIADAVKSFTRQQLQAGDKIAKVN